MTLTATVNGAGGTPTGRVAFTYGTKTLGSAALVDGTATLTYTFKTQGSYNLTATYEGSTKYSTSQGTDTQTVQAGNGVEQRQRETGRGCHLPVPSRRERIPRKNRRR